MNKMILIDEATVKLALEALEKYCTPYQDGTHPADDTIIALREALASEAKEQPAQQQEPVGKKTRIGLVTSAGWDSLPVGTEFYTSPQAQRPWVGLTDKEIYKIANDLFYGNGPCDTLAMCRAIEAAHGIKE